MQLRRRPSLLLQLAWLLVAASAVSLIGLSCTGLLTASTTVMQQAPRADAGCSTATGGGGAAAANGSAAATADDGPVAAAARVGLLRESPQLGPLSAPWAPLALAACTDGLPRHAAPCIAAREASVAFGEELLYPDFSIPEPGFLTDAHRDAWRAKAAVHTERYVLRNGRAFFLAQHGQVLVLKDAAYQGRPAPDVWAPDECMNGATSHRGLAPLPKGGTPDWPGRAVIANSPDSWSLQHFLDRVTKLLVQTEAWRRQGTKVLTGRSTGVPHVADIWAALVTGRDQEVVHGSRAFSAGELVFPCRCPLIHPFFHARLRELLGVPEAAPLADRKVVLYLSRNRDGGSNSGTRRVTNEDAVLAALRAALEERGRGEQLVLFGEAQRAHPGVLDLARYMAANVSAMVGPHGGAWYNAWWVGRGTFLLEFLPMSRFATMVWEEGVLAGGRYWVLPVESSEARGHDMEVDPQLAAAALKDQLGRAHRPEEGALPYYQWELGQVTRRAGLR